MAGNDLPWPSWRRACQICCGALGRALLRRLTVGTVASTGHRRLTDDDVEYSCTWTATPSSAPSQPEIIWLTRAVAERRATSTCAAAGHSNSNCCQSTLSDLSPFDIRWCCDGCAPSKAARVVPWWGGGAAPNPIARWQHDETRDVWDQFVSRLELDLPK